jgi:HSP20 family protein
VQPLHRLDELMTEFKIVQEGRDFAVDMYREEGALIVKMHIPGIEPDKVDIRVDGDTLIVSGARDEEHEEQDQHYYHHEIQCGSFVRDVRLPFKVDEAGTRAAYKHGVLKVYLPLKERKAKNLAKIKIDKK